MTITHYLDDLGIANFEFVEEEVDVVAAQAPQTPLRAKKIITQMLIVEKDSQHSFCKSGATQVLLDKMLTAIGADAANTTRICSNSIERLANTYTADIIVLAGDFQQYASDYFVIPHPQQILENPDLKRDAWEVLKKIKEHL